MVTLSLLDADGGVATLPSDEAGNGVAECYASRVSAGVPTGHGQHLQPNRTGCAAARDGGCARAAGEHKKSALSFSEGLQLLGGALNCHSMWWHISRSIG
jgi:hypothetical protein